MKRSILISKYSDHLIFRNYSKNTVSAYIKVLNNFFDFCSDHSDNEETVIEYAKMFLTDLFSQGLSWSTVNVNYSAIRILCIHIMDIAWDYKLVPRPRGRRTLPSVLSGRQIETMINQMDNVKHKSIILLLYSSGIRISELIALRVSNVLVDRNQLRIVNGKGSKDRIVDIPERAMKLLIYYMKEYQPKTMLYEGHRKGERYSRSSVRKIISRAGQRAEVLFRPTPHSFRYAYATHHLEVGTNLVVLQHQLGHSHLKTTLEYIKLCKTRSQKLNHPTDLLKLDLPTETI